MRTDMKYKGSMSWPEAVSKYPSGYFQPDYEKTIRSGRREDIHVRVFSIGDEESGK